MDRFMVNAKKMGISEEASMGGFRDEPVYGLHLKSR